MRNRAKCALCKEIIESFHVHDYVTCKCEEISVDGGQNYYKASAKDWRNFLRVDDLGNEIAVEVKEKADQEPIQNNDEEKQKPSRRELLDLLKDTIRFYEEMPEKALYSPITGYDLLSSLMLVSSILEAFDES